MATISPCCMRPCCVNREITFDTDPTHTATTAAEAFKLRRGVCQDITHIFSLPPRVLSASRHATWGATSTASTASPRRRPVTPGRRPMSRTWAGSGFDPTNGISTTDAHVRVAVGSLLPWGCAGVRHALRVCGETLTVAVRVARRVSRFRIEGDALPKGHPHRYNLMAGSSEKSKKHMTYCCGILVQAGLVMVADTRTNAGLDNISTFRKLHVYSQPGERIMAIASSGNLSLSQSVRSTLTEGVQNPDTANCNADERADDVPGCATYRLTIRNLQHAEKVLAAAEVDHEVAFLFGGQIKGGRLQSFMIYSAGNFIECTIDTSLSADRRAQIRKPVLDRAIAFDTDLYDALKIGLISMDDDAFQSRRSASCRLTSWSCVGTPARPRRTTASSQAEPYFLDLRATLVVCAARCDIAISAPAISELKLVAVPRSLNHRINLRFPIN